MGEAGEASTATNGSLCNCAVSSQAKLGAHFYLSILMGGLQGGVRNAEKVVGCPGQELTAIQG